MSKPIGVVAPVLPATLAEQVPMSSNLQRMKGDLGKTSPIGTGLHLGRKLLFPEAVWVGCGPFPSGSDDAFLPNAFRHN